MSELPAMELVPKLFIILQHLNKNKLLFNQDGLFVTILYQDVLIAILKSPCITRIECVLKKNGARHTRTNRYGVLFCRGGGNLARSLPSILASTIVFKLFLTC